MIQDKIFYYAWKNRGKAFCNRNSLRADEANEYGFNKLWELLTNEKMVKYIVKIDNELEKLDKRRAKLFEAYEDEILTKEEFRERKSSINSNPFRQC